jgi:hypothetical protein
MNQPSESKPSELHLVKTIKGVLALQPLHPGPPGEPHPTAPAHAHPSPPATAAGASPAQPPATAAKPAGAQPPARGTAPIAGTTPTVITPEADLRAIEAWENEGDPN